MTLKYESELLFDLMKRDGDDAPSDVLPYESELKEKYLNQVVGAYPKLQDYRPEWLYYNLYHHIPSDFPVESVANVTSVSFYNVVPYTYKSAILKGNTDYKSVDWITNFHYQHGIEFTNGKVGYIERDARCSTCVDINENRRFILKASSNIDISIVTADENNNVIKDYLWFITTTDETRFTVEDNCKFLYLNFRKKDLSAFTSESEVINSGLTVKEQNLVSVKMPVLTTTGKNLFNNTLEYGDFDNSTGIPNNFSPSIIRTKKYNEILPNGTYRITVFNETKKSSAFIVHEYDNDFNYIKSTSSDMFTTSANTKYIKFRFRKHDSAQYTIEELRALSCMITEGNTIPTTYEPYKSNILSVTENVVLRGIGEVQDTLDCLTGEMTERIGEVVLDGSQPMDADSFGVYIQMDDVKKLADYTNIITCDKLPTIPTYRDLPKVTNGISGYSRVENYLGQNWLYLKINNSVDKNEIAQWLSENPITVQYHLETESIKTVDLTVTNQDGNTESIIRPIEGTMHVSTSSQALPPLLDMSVPVEATTQNLMSFANIVEEE